MPWTEQELAVKELLFASGLSFDPRHVFELQADLMRDLDSRREQRGRPEGGFQESRSPAQPLLGRTSLTEEDCCAGWNHHKSHPLLHDQVRNQPQGVEWRCPET